MKLFWKFLMCAEEVLRKLMYHWWIGLTEPLCLVKKICNDCHSGFFNHRRKDLATFSISVKKGFATFSITCQKRFSDIFSHCWKGLATSSITVKRRCSGIFSHCRKGLVTSSFTPEEVFLHQIFSWGKVSQYPFAKKILCKLINQQRGLADFFDCHLFWTTVTLRHWWWMDREKIRYIWCD